MSTHIDSVVQAFPTDHDGQIPGMTLRDYFAAKAMQPFAADPNAPWSNGVTGMAASAYDRADEVTKAGSTT